MKVEVDQNGSDTLVVLYDSIDNKLKIVLANSSTKLNISSAIQTKIRALPVQNGIDFSQWSVTSSGTWNTDENGYRYGIRGSEIATITGGIDQTEKATYTFTSVGSKATERFTFFDDTYTININQGDTPEDLAQKLYNQIVASSYSPSRQDNKNLKLYYNITKGASGQIIFTSKLENTDIKDLTILID